MDEVLHHDECVCICEGPACILAQSIQGVSGIDREDIFQFEGEASGVVYGGEWNILQMWGMVCDEW